MPQQPVNHIHNLHTTVFFLAETVQGKSVLG